MGVASEGEFLALFGDRYRRIDDLLAAFAQASGQLFVTDISPHAAAELFAVRFPDRRRRIIDAPLFRTVLRRRRLLRALEAHLRNAGAFVLRQIVRNHGEEARIGVPGAARTEL